MMILAYYIFIDLLSSTSGQTVQLSLSKAYVNTSDPVTITCSVAVVIIDTVVISKDGINIFRCPSPPISCSNLGIVSAYSAVQNDTAGTTTMTISGSNISRDAGNWTCQYGTNFTSTPVSLAVVTPPSSSRLIEESGYIILELICTYPYISLDFQFYLGNDSYTEGNSNKTVTNASCTSAYEASVNYTLTFSQHSKSYSGTFNIFVNNGFYIARFIGARQYNFTAVTTTTEATNVTPLGKPCQLELGLGLGLSFGTPCVITCIIVAIFMYKGYTYAHILGLVLGLGIGITFQVSWIIIASPISTGNQCKLELGLGLGLGSGFPCVIALSVAVIFLIFVCTGIPGAVDIGKGILNGLLIASVIGIVVFLLNQKNKTKTAGPPAVHKRTQNKVEPITASKQINDRHQPLRSADTGVEDTPKIRPQPQPPQNSDIKDRIQRGISATTDNPPVLPSETPRPSKLAPLSQKQPMVEEEDASAEPKKKRKKKKKKGQMNDGNPEEETVQLTSTRTFPETNMM